MMRFCMSVILAMAIVFAAVPVSVSAQQRPTLRPRDNAQPAVVQKQKMFLQLQGFSDSDGFKQGWADQADAFNFIRLAIENQGNSVLVADQSSADVIMTVEVSAIRTGVRTIVDPKKEIAATAAYEGHRILTEVLYRSGHETLARISQAGERYTYQQAVKIANPWFEKTWTVTVHWVLSDREGQILSESRAPQKYVYGVQELLDFQGRETGQQAVFLRSGGDLSTIGVNPQVNLGTNWYHATTYLAFLESLKDKYIIAGGQEP